jgi:chloramphenicol-sensitive protein RarD
MAGRELGEAVGGSLAFGLETSDATAAAPQSPRSLDEKSIAGLLFGLATYTYWGFQPLYFKLVQQVPPAAMVAHRTTWCAVLMVLLLTVLRRWPDFSRALSKRLVFLLTLSSLMLATNWLIYLASVVSGRIVETSLGYFINPLFSVLLGIVFLRERPGRLQVGAIVLAAIGIAYLVFRLPFVPWLALGVAGTFGLYGLIRKVARVESLTGLTIETLLLTPLTGGYLVWVAMRGNDVFGGMGNGGQILVIGQRSDHCHPVVVLWSGGPALAIVRSGVSAVRRPQPAIGLGRVALSRTIQFRPRGQLWIHLGGARSLLG